MKVTRHGLHEAANDFALLFLIALAFLFLAINDVELPR